MYYELKIKETKTLIMTILTLIMVIVPIHWMLQAGLSLITYDQCQRQWTIDQNISENLDEVYAKFALKCYG